MPRLERWEVKDNTISVQDEDLANVARTQKTDLIREISRQTRIKVDPREIEVDSSGVVSISNLMFVQMVNEGMATTAAASVNVFCFTVDIKIQTLDVYCGLD